MGLYQPPKFKQLDRATGKWKTVIPEPRELEKPGYTALNVRTKNMKLKRD